MALQLTMCYLGVPIHRKTHVFGNNESVVKSGSLPHLRLHKCHHGLSYHYTWEVVASDAIAFHFLPGHLNPADILSKHWGYQQIWSTLQPLLFWHGDTGDLLDQEYDRSQKKGRDKYSISEDALLAEGEETGDRQDGPSRAMSPKKADT